MTDPVQELRQARENVRATQVAHDTLATQIRAHRDTLNNIRAQMTTQAFISSRTMMEGARAQAAAEEAFINQNMRVLTQRRAEYERARVTVSFWENQVQMAEQRTRAAARNQPATDNQVRPTAPTTPQVAAPVATPVIQPAPTPGTDGQAPAPNPTSPPTTPATPTAPTETGGQAQTPAADQPAGTPAAASLTADLAAPPALPPEEVIAPRADHRIRLSAFDRNNQQAKEDLYGPNNQYNLLKPLWDTDGVLFPYTPTIQINQETTWQTADLEHSNFDILSFQRSSSAQISLTADFTVQNQREGRYLLAVIHFLRTVSKAYFGAQDVERFDPPQQQQATDTPTQTPQEATAETTTRARQDGKAGLPPPVLLFSGYGELMFNDLRVVVKSHNWSYEKTADLIKIVIPSAENATRSVWLPPMMTISMSLAIQNNTDRMRDRFNLDEFRTGNLLKYRGWF